MSSHDPVLIAKVDELRAKQRRVQEALAKVRGKGYGLNAAVVVELDANGELVRCEVMDAASGLNGESIAGGFRRAYNEARKNAKQHVAEIIGELETDRDASAAIKEIQSYFGIEPEAGSAKTPATRQPVPDDDEDYEPPQSWLEKA